MRTLTYDIGGTAIKFGLFQDGKLQFTQTFETLAFQGAQNVMQRVIDHATQFKEISAIGISTCGQVEAETGVIAYANSNMPGYTGMHVKEKLMNALHVPVYVENDVVCAGLGEYTSGAAKGYDDFLLVTFGTGIGGTLFINGKPYNGKGPSNGIMIGGMQIALPFDHDPWGASYEAVASVTSLVKQAQRIDPSLQNGKQILARMQEDKIQKCVCEWEKRVTQGICSLIHLYNVPLVILGGGIMENDMIFTSIKDMIHLHLIPGFYGTAIEKASLGNQAGLYGAYSLCYNTI